MILTACEERTTELFPLRVPEPNEAMTPEESEAFSHWQQSPSGLAFYSALAEQIVARIGVRQGRILSVGEGDGLLSSQLASLLPRAEILGLDLCPVMVQRAQERPDRPANLVFRAGSVYELDRMGKADAVVCVSSFHHFEQAELAVEQMVSALAPGGKLYLVDLRRDANAGAYFRWLDAYVQRGELVKAGIFRLSVAAAHTLEELSGLLKPSASREAARLEVAALRFCEDARLTYQRLDPDGVVNWPAMKANMAGLLVEALYSLPAESAAGGK